MNFELAQTLYITPDATNNTVFHRMKKLQALPLELIYIVEESSSYEL